MLTEVRISQSEGDPTVAAAAAGGGGRAGDDRQGQDSPAGSSDGARGPGSSAASPADLSLGQSCFSNTHASAQALAHMRMHELLEMALSPC